MTSTGLSHDHLKLNELSYIKINALLLLAIIPLSIIGYFLAVSDESLFFVYEWALVVLLSCTFLLSIVTALVYKSSLLWLSFSFLAFILQFAVFCLFIGPYTFYPLFFAYYIMATISIIVSIITFKKGLPFRFITVIFMSVTILVTVYMILLNSLWGVNWT
ncbi:hypothetical protein [Guptibacillus hwajinpoensis]|uniref:hypothetical protein n=1 Tax=Guptibacillus hwajinpoensis TaxID=208199 RepID=UPI001CFDFAAB|nr:hypothetical protein [Pseudalkalibacillus hwajinpoensis]WLR58920.1 hypothetical protein LC071_17425 [Pseudalkalibacillus hwajinpoensis]